MTLTVALYDDFSRRMVWRVPDHVAYVNECPLHPPVRIRGWTKPAARLAPPPPPPPSPGWLSFFRSGGLPGGGEEVFRREGAAWPPPSLRDFHPLSAIWRSGDRQASRRRGPIVPDDLTGGRGVRPVAASDRGDSGSLTFLRTAERTPAS